METQKRQSRPNPRESANALSALFFWWTIDLFREGYRKELTQDDLFEPLKGDHSRVLGDKLERQWNKEVEKSKRTKGQPSLKIALMKTFAWEYGKLAFIVLISDIGIRLGQPILLGQLLAYFKPGGTMERSEAFFYAGGIVLFSALNTIIMNHFMLLSMHAGMKVRAACCSLIYRKALRLSRTALGETAAGQVVNLLSNDVGRFDLVSMFLHSLWSAPLVTIIVAYLMWLEMGWAAFVGIGVVFIVVPLQTYTGKLSAVFRRKTAFKTDKRVRLMDEILSGIQVIKMYAWEKPFSKLVILARRAEIKVVTKQSYIRGIYMMFHLCTTRIALFAMLITMAVTDQPLYVNQVFVALSYFNIISMSISSMFVRAIAEVAEALVSIKRLRDFMLHDEFASSQSPLEAYWKPNTPVSNGSLSLKEKKGRGDDEGMVVLQKVTAKWDSDSIDDTLSGVDLSVPRGKLIIVIGHVGAGKSSLLQAVLGELVLSSGSCTVQGKVSYACQEPWVFSSTVRKNIVFGQEFNRRRYNEVVRVCALQRDFEQFPQGDMTIVGERGTSLSGGQKARVNLARAVYNDADIYLLDDPLSAVDTHVGKHLLEECINGYLGNKTRILVTHQLQFLSEADHIVILNNGVVEMQGSFHELSNKVDYVGLLGMQEEQEQLEDSIDEKPEGDRLHNMLRQISIKSRSSSRDLRSSSDLREEETAEAKAAAAERAEASSKGMIGGKSVYLEYCKAGGNWFIIIIVAVLFALAQAAASGSDYFVSYWVGIEELRLTNSSGRLKDDVNKSSNTVMSAPLNDFTETNVSMSALVEDGNSTTYSSLHQEHLDKHTYVYIYSAIVVSLFVVTFIRSFSFYKVCMKASEKLHHIMFHNIIRTRMRFFDLNPSGRILNRFSKDIGSIDELLPKAILDASQVQIMMLGCLIMVLIVNYMLVLPLIVVSFVFWLDRRIYLKTSKNIKRMEGITKSPVFTHLHATLQGLTTIRAYGAQNILRDEFDKHQDLHSSAWYMFLTTSVAFGFTLDLLSLVYITCVTFSFLIFEGSMGGEVALAITQSMALTGMIQWGIRQSAEVANQMMAVERILEYAALEPEPSLESPPAKKPPKEWPPSGKIEFSNVYLKYSETETPVINDLNVLIKPQEKVGIVGRTGAGKSSLIATLFRLAWVEGKVIIDDIDTRDIALQELRSKISIIPQDPVLFSGTMRKNLDPFEEYPDSQLWEAIQEVELKDALHESHGLQSRVAEGGSNFSVGQRQLVCLARAIIRNNRILMLDEATANVDPHTDSLIQQTIRHKFRDCTVLTVAHRLNTIMDSDKVLVMDAGRMVEFDHPHILLQKEEGYFYSMVQQTGKAMAEQLAKVAEESYRSLQS